MNPLEKLNQAIIQCQACPRLKTHCATIAKVKRRQYQNEPYWGKPVPGFGSPNPRLWIVGLAPGAHGANRTGRVFTGDNSGKWLYSALHRFGLSSHPESIGPQDGLILKDTYISCVCRCAPPQNRPTSKEIETCKPFLETDWKSLHCPPIILALGKTAFENVLKLLIEQNALNRKRDWKFGHLADYQIGKSRLLASYHPSQQNTFTGKLTAEMWDAVFKKVMAHLKSHPLRKN